MSGGNKYELEMIVKEGTFTHPCPVSNLFVSTSIDGVMNAEDNTNIAKLDHGHVVWNKRIVKTFETLEPKIPIMISLSMYRKNHFHSGSKLIGTSHFSISELIPILDKDSVQGRIQLNVKKHANSSGSFLLSLKLKTLCPDQSPNHPARSPTKQNVPLTLQYKNDDTTETVSSKFESQSKEHIAPFVFSTVLVLLMFLLFSIYISSCQ